MKVKSLGNQTPHRYGGKWMINKKTDHRMMNDVINEYKDVKMRTDWETARLDVMILALLHKFSEPKMREKIISIPDNALLVEHTTRDKIWGDGGDGGTGEKGTNYLGKILTAISHVLKHGNCKKMSKEMKEKVYIGKKKQEWER